MKEYTEDMLALLSEILPNVAQELRGAMANVYQAANRLAPMDARERSKSVDADASVFLQSYYRMYRVIGNLTDAQLLADTRRFERLPGDDIVGIVRDVCERAEALFESEGVTLTFESDKAGQIIAVDAALIERLLLNLLSNALKFTPAGGAVAVRVRVTPRTVYLSVTDTGCGIAPEKLAHVFEAYLHKNVLEAAPHGMGLGLALCRRIAQGHGGTIVASSEKGKGAAFTVSLPNVRPAGATLCAPKSSYSGGFNPILLELSDALSAGAFSYRYLD
ncbi:MAG: HAMP domain-containing histidine kinase [Oscillospiraceae bacterium]|nr:HAMP domain-containing histidine kinase [Oscillospiraceae bacterium]